MDITGLALRTSMRLFRGVFEVDRLSIQRKRALIDGFTAAIRKTPGMAVHTSLMDGVAVRMVSAGMPTDPAGSVMLYLHGGGYGLGSARGYERFAAAFAAAADMPVIVPDYSLSPEHPYPAAMDEVEKVYRTMLGSGYDPARIVVAGDSAGGGMALALTMRLRGKGVPLPAALGLISPWLDLAADAEGRRPAGRDPLVTKRQTAIWARNYVQEHDYRNPEISPIYGTFDGLPPIVLHSAELDPLSFDGFMLEALIRRTGSGPELTHHVWPNRWHVFHIQTGLLSDATSAVGEMAIKLREYASASGAVPDSQAQ